MTRRALVTGGARRVGLAIARELARTGAHLTITYSGTSAAEVTAATSALLADGAGSVMAIRADLARPEAIAALASAVEDTGGADWLINSAGNFVRGDFLETSAEDFDRAIAVNLRAPFLLTQALAPGMKKRGYGRVVNIADIAGINPFDDALAHSAAKGGLVALTRGLAHRLAPEILVSAIAPGAVLPPSGWSEEKIGDAAASNLLGRFGGAEEVARAVRFLVESDFITGSVLVVDGGSLLRPGN